MSRKQVLSDRALKVGKARKEDWLHNEHADLVSDFAAAYEQGYRAAMRDARRAFNSHCRYSLRCIALIEWLRPLR
jgi:hypothetical protein